MKESINRIFNHKFFVVVLPLLLVAWVVFYNDLLLGGKFLWEDQTNYFYPLRMFAASSFEQWGITFWNPKIFAGAPFIADIQTAYFYPTNLLFNIIYKMVGGFGYSTYQLFALSHMFLMSIATYIAVRLQKGSTLKAIFFAIFYTYAAFNTLHFIHFSFIQTTLLFPLIISLFSKYLDHKNSKIGVLLSVCLGVSFLGGYAQYLYGLMIFLSLFWVYDVVSKKAYKNRTMMIGKLFALIYLGLGITLSLFQWLPTADFVKETTRKDLTLKDSQISSVDYKRAINLVSPRFYGEISENAKQSKTPYWWGSSVQYEYWETAMFFGVIPLLLFVFTIAGLNRRDMILSIAVSLFIFALMLGKNFFLYELFFNYFPGFDMFRNAGRYSYFLLLFAFSLLLFRSDEIIEKLQLKKALIITGSISAFTFLFYISTKYPNSTVQSFSLKQILISIVMLVVVVAVFKIKKDKERIFWIVLILALFADLKLADSNFSSASINPEQKHGVTNPAKQFISGKDNFMRMQSRSGRMMIWERNSGMVNGIELVEGYNPLMLNDFYEFWFKFKCDIRPEMLNVKYGLNSKVGKVVRLNQWPRFFFTNQLIEVDNIFQYDNLLEKRDAKSTFALVTEDFGVPNSKPETQTIDNSFYSPDEQIFTVSTSDKSLFVLNEVYFKNFKAKVDGEETHVHKVNGIHRAVVIPEGEHTLEFYYDKKVFYIGGVVSFIGLLILALLFFKQKRVRIESE